MKTTREAELELLEIARDKSRSLGHETKENRRASILESVYEQTKDPHLEKMRLELQKWIIFGLEHSPDEGVEPTKDQRMAMAKAEFMIQEIEKKVQKYIQSPGIQEQIVRKMSQHDPDYAEAIVVKQKRRS